LLHFEIGEAAEQLDAALTAYGKADASYAFPAVSIDSRSIRPGEAFFAIKGPRLDGHRFVGEAVERGADVLVVSEPVNLPLVGRPLFVLQVSDTTRALQKLARWVRLRWGGPIIAVTGSVGKTTTRRFTSHLLRENFRIHETAGNFNNEYGLPLTLLALEETHELAVLELGMSHAGEIRLLADICRPDTGLITNIAPVHLEFFPGLREIAEAKAELLEKLSAEGHFFFNRDDAELRRVARRFPGGKTGFGFGQDCDVRITELQILHLRKMRLSIRGRLGEYRTILPFIGRPAAYNLAAALAIAEFYEVQPDMIHRRIPDLRPPAMRGEILSIGRITLWNDTYNANPLAVEALLETLGSITGYPRKVVVLGDMLELGRDSEKFHRRAGRQAASCGPDLLITVGRQAAVIGEAAEESGFPSNRIFHLAGAEEAAIFLAERLEPGDLVAIKGSRGLKMETVVQQLREATV